MDSSNLSCYCVAYVNNGVDSKLGLSWEEAWTIARRIGFILTDDYQDVVDYSWEGWL